MSCGNVFNRTAALIVEQKLNKCLLVMIGRRFLNNSDYLNIITQEALQQLTRGNDEQFIQAEQSAEMSIVEYLSENYEVEKELAKSK